MVCKDFADFSTRNFPHHMKNTMVGVYLTSTFTLILNGVAVALLILWRTCSDNKRGGSRSNSKSPGNDAGSCSPVGYVIGIAVAEALSAATVVLQIELLLNSAIVKAATMPPQFLACSNAELLQVQLEEGVWMMVSVGVISAVLALLLLWPAILSVIYACCCCWPCCQRKRSRRSSTTSRGVAMQGPKHLSKKNDQMTVI